MNTNMDKTGSHPGPPPLKADRCNVAIAFFQWLDYVEPPVAYSVTIQAEKII
jgi:hypothetical protein